MAELVPGGVTFVCDGEEFETFEEARAYADEVAAACIDRYEDGRMVERVALVEP